MNYLQYIQNAPAGFSSWRSWFFKKSVYCVYWWCLSSYHSCDHFLYIKYMLYIIDRFYSSLSSHTINVSLLSSGLYWTILAIQERLAYYPVTNLVKYVWSIIRIKYRYYKYHRCSSSLRHSGPLSSRTLTENYIVVIYMVHKSQHKASI